jgi:hypothetical protein
MNSAPPFSRAEAAHRLGPAAIAIARRNVDAAPPIRPEIKEQIRAVFLSGRAARGQQVAPAA